MIPDFSALDDPNNPKKPPMGDFAALGVAQQPVGAPQAMKPPQDFAQLESTQQPVGAPQAPKPPTGTPPPMSPTPAMPTGAMDPNKAWGDLTAQFQTKHGRAMTAEEGKALQGYAGYTGGAINQGMIDKATQGIGAYSGNLANPFGPAATTPAAGPTDPGIKTGGMAQTELQKLLTTGGTDGMQLDMNNPAIQAQRSNFDRTNSRATTQQRLAGAERSAARGTLGSGGFDADMAGAEQASGDRASGFEAQLMTQELGGQRDRVMQGLQMAMQSGDSAQARALQERLGTLDATIRREGNSNQYNLGRGQLGLGLLNARLGDKQAGNALGLGYFNAQNGANQNLLNSLLGGF